MNSRERIMTAAKGGKPDIVPAFPYIGNYGAAVAGVPIGKYIMDGKVMAEAQLKAWELLKLDGVVAQSDNYYMAEGFGCKTLIQENSVPQCLEPALKRLEDVDRLKEIDPYSGRMGVYIEAASILKEKLGNEIAIRTCGTGCFSLAGHVLGMENFINEIVFAEADEDEERQELLLQLMEKTSDALIAFDTAIIKAGSDFANCGDSAASLDLISPAIYEKYAWPFEKKVFSALKPVCEEYGAAIELHICGNTKPILKKMSETGADIIEIDHKVPMKEAREIVGDRICLKGNLDPIEVLMNGSEELVEEYSRRAIEDAGKNGAFILGSGCEVAVQTPVRNIVRLRETAHGYRY